MDRRSFLKLAGGTVAFVSGGQLVYGSTVPQEVRSSLAFHLASDLPKLDGIFVFDDAVCRAMADDFGHYVHKMPIGVLLPKSVEDIKKIIAYAKSKSVKIAMRGHGCSAYGQTQVEGGIVINASVFNEITWVGTDSIDVRPGATWHEIVDETMPKGLTPAVLPDTLVLTAGGSLSVGGIGETSYRLGAMVDNVLEIDVLTADGSLMTCSRTRNSELFSNVLAGMGQNGLIVRARLPLLKSPKNVVVRELAYGAQRASFVRDLGVVAQEERQGAVVGRLAKAADGSWNAFITATSWLDADTEAAAPSWLKSVTGAMVGAPKVMPYDKWVHRNTKGWKDSVKSGAAFVPHPYMSFFLPEHKTLEMVDFLATDKDAPLGAATIPVFPMLTANFKMPLQRMPKGSLVHHVRIYRKPAVEGTPDHLRMIKMNNEYFVPWILNAGGTVYPPHAPILNQAQWAAHFGDQWPVVQTAKAKHDPERLLNPGAGIFV